MKKLILGLCLMLGALQATAGNGKRLVLIEEFTNTGCGPCATWSPVLDSCINNRLGDCIAIKYHSGFPLATDEFYLYDRASQQQKVDFYNVTGVPATYINGMELGDRTYTFLDQAISYCAELPETFRLNVEKQLKDHRLSVSATLSPLADTQNTHLRLFVAAIEEHIVARTPYANGERELYYTMRKLMTGADGHDPGALLKAGSDYAWEGQWTVDFCDNEQLLGVVAFLQDMETREVLATAYSGPDAEGDNRLKLISLSGTPDQICTPHYYGTVVFRNDGANPVTHATLNVEVNGEVAQYLWAGHLDYLDRDTLTFSDFTGYELDPEGHNRAAVWFTDVNSSGEASNIISTTFSNAIQATYGVQLKIYTDKKPEETTWNLYNSAGDVVRQGGPYQEARKFLTIPLELTTDDCYQLEFLDAGGDGIKGQAGNGYYQLMQTDATGKTTRIAQGDYDGARHVVFFSLTGTPAPEKPRLVLFEEFTNTSCDPCADFSPALDDAIYRRLGQMVAITYHYNFPSNRDPFYLANPTDAMARANYYGISGVPALFVDGERAHTQGELLDGYIDYERRQQTTVDIDADATLSPDGRLDVSVSLLPQGISSGDDLRLFVAALEERIEWAQPADNGERAWNYVMRKLLPSAQGQPLEKELTQTVPYTYDLSWQLSGYDDDRQLGLVCFVQNIKTGHVLGTCYTPRPNGSTRNAKIVQVIGAPQRICTPQFTADLMVRNTGRETLTSCNVNVSINGSLQQTPWTGRLDYLETDTLRIPPFSDFQLAQDASNQVEIWLSDLNGQSEQSLPQTITVTNAHKARNAVRLTIMTDQHPEETTWALLNSAGDVVCQGGPYQEARKRIAIDLPLDSDDCYTVEFDDTGGNGIDGDYGHGYYMLHEVDASGKTRLLVQATYTEALHSVSFSLESASTQGIAPRPRLDPRPQDGPATTLDGRPLPHRGLDPDSHRSTPHRGLDPRSHRSVIISNGKKIIR